MLYFVSGCISLVILQFSRMNNNESHAHTTVHQKTITNNTANQLSYKHPVLSVS